MFSNTVQFTREAVSFDERAYLQNKADALNAQQGQSRWTLESTLHAINSAGMDPWQHFTRFGAFERAADGTWGIAPSNGFDFDAYYKAAFNKSIYFDEQTYLRNKTDALNAEHAMGKSDWTTESTSKAIRDAGMDPWSHFTQFGAFERNAESTMGINPSKYFDLDRYYTEKLAQCAEAGEHYTKDALVSTFMKVGLDPVTHHALYGFAEMLAPRMDDAGSFTIHRLKGGEYDPDNVQSGDYKIDSLLIVNARAQQWNYIGDVQENTLYYHFPSQAPNKYFNHISNFSEFNADQKEAVHHMMQYVGKITGINFSYTSDADKSNFMFYENDLSYMGPGTIGFTNEQSAGAIMGLEKGASTYTSIGNLTKIGIELATDDPKTSDLLPQGESLGYALLLHEFGHALGFRHPFSPGPYPYPETVMLPHAEDGRIYSQLSYTYPPSAENPWSGTDSWWVGTNSHNYYSPYDLMALQYVYGTDGLGGSEGMLFDHDYYQATKIIPRTIWGAAAYSDNYFDQAG